MTDESCRCSHLWVDISASFPSKPRKLLEHGNCRCYQQKIASAFRRAHSANTSPLPPWKFGNFSGSFTSVYFRVCCFFRSKFMEDALARANSLVRPPPGMVLPVTQYTCSQQHRFNSWRVIFLQKRRGTPRPRRTRGRCLVRRRTAGRTVTQARPRWRGGRPA